VVPALRSVLGLVGVAGGATTGIFTGAGLSRSGALVVAFATQANAASGTASVAADDVAEAGRGAARIVMAGWPSQQWYPRGFGLGFTSSGSPLRFLEAWRQMMGPKMRTVCSVMPERVVGGALPPTDGASVACLKASYATGFGDAEGFAPGAAPDPRTLVYGAQQATTMALKGLDEGATRLVLMVESAARYEALGAEAPDEWAGVASEVGDRAPCVGWLCDRVAAYGRGVAPIDTHGSLIIAAVGDRPALVG
jgi:hypothetical protein